MKVGDKVRALKDCFCHFENEQHFTKGKIYIVKEVKEKIIMVEKDDQGHTDNGWQKHCFEVVNVLN